LVALAQSLDTPTSRSANTRVIRLRHNDAKALTADLAVIRRGCHQISSVDVGA
jgi:general secretion pathway protein D